MTLNEIKKAVKEGKKVYFQNDQIVIFKDNQFLITFENPNDPLAWLEDSPLEFPMPERKGELFMGKEEDFFTCEKERNSWKRWK